MRWIAPLILFLFSTSVLAADLTDSDIQRWLNAMPNIVAWQDAHEDQLDDEEDDIVFSTDMKKMIDQAIEQLKRAGLYNDFNRLIKQQGYSTIYQWGEYTQRISLAYMAMLIDEEQVSLADMETQLAMIKNMDGFDEQEKAMMVTGIEASIELFKESSKISKAERALIRRHRAALDEQFNGFDE
ncbi:MAG: hypothetical protein IBX52_12670 [Bacterioplanes sp.]|nr:hypothetical protein [Bacterioplanes sp.]